MTIPESVFLRTFVYELETKAGCTIAAASAPQREPEVGVSRVFIFPPRPVLVLH